MRIFITHSYFLKLDPKQLKKGQPYPPLATLMAVSWLKQRGHEVLFFDNQFEQNSFKCIQRLEDFKPEAVVIYEDGFNYLTKMCLTNMREEAFKILKASSKIGVLDIWVSSSDATDHKKQYLENGATHIIVGEGEMTLKELAEGKPKAEITGLAMLSSGKLFQTSPRKVLKDLDQIPHPDFTQINIEAYRSFWKSQGGLSLNIATTRGCPFKCNWCAKPIYGNRYNAHSPAYVVGLMKMYHENFQVKHLWFSDDIFGLKPGWVSEFSKLLKAEELKIPFKIQSRADLLLQENTIAELASAGCEEVWIGAESGSQAVLDAMDKGTSIAQIEQATKLMKAHGIKPCFFIQLGYKGETWQDLQKTIKLIDRLNPYDIGVSVSYPLPGTHFYDTVFSDLKEKSNWTDSDELLLMYKGTFQPKFYKWIHRYIHRRFRRRSAQKQFLKAPIKQLMKWGYHGFFELVLRLGIPIQKQEYAS